jgi:hypothetical protein
MAGMDVNPYQSPEAPEEQARIREVGAVWVGWSRFRQVGFVLIMLTIAVAGPGKFMGMQFGTIPSLILLVVFAAGLAAAIAGRAGVYVNLITNMFRGDYD